MSPCRNLLAALLALLCAACSPAAFPAFPPTAVTSPASPVTFTPTLSSAGLPTSPSNPHPSPPTSAAHLPFVSRPPLATPSLATLSTGKSPADFAPLVLTPVPTRTTSSPAAGLSSATLTPALSPTEFAYAQASVQTGLADVWDDPAYEGSTWHRQTQLILGEPVLVVQTRGDWSQVLAIAQPSHKHPRGYPGWVRSRALVTGWPHSNQWLVVMAPSAPLYDRPLESAAFIARAPLDTRLPLLLDSGAWLAARLPDGRNAWLQRGFVRLADQPDDPYQPGALLSTAQPLLGAPYLWGGAAPAAFDCAGFVYRLFHAHGIRLPRDADDQAALGQPVDPAALQPGDLLFFASQPGGPITHVALAVDAAHVLDASSPAGLAARPLSAVLANHTYVTARRIFP